MLEKHTNQKIVNFNQGVKIIKKVKMKNIFIIVGSLFISNIYSQNIDFKAGNFKDQWRLVGNAVPPLLTKVISKEIKKQLF